MICSCGLDVGANKVYPSADRTSSGIIARGEWRLGAGLKSKSTPGREITGRANWVNAKPRNSASLGHGRRIDLDRGHRLGEPPVRQTRQRAIGDEPDAGSAVGPLDAHAVRKMLLAELDHAGDRSPAASPPSPSGQGSTMGKPVMNVSRWSKTASMAARSPLIEAVPAVIISANVVSFVATAIRLARDRRTTATVVVLASAGNRRGSATRDGRARASTARRCR